MTSKLPSDEARISTLVEGFISAFEEIAPASAGDDPGLVALRPQLFAKVTQSFVDFGNLVSAALPEMFDPEAGDAVEALADAVSDDAEAQAGTASALAEKLADHIEGQPDPAPELEQVLASVRAIEGYWREVAGQIDAVPALLRKGDARRVAELRALPPIWDRVVARVNEVQQTQQAPVATPGGPSLKPIEGGKGKGKHKEPGA